jgi:hypothetical protein
VNLASDRPRHPRACAVGGDSRWNRKDAFVVAFCSISLHTEDGIHAAVLKSPNSSHDPSASLVSAIPESLASMAWDRQSPAQLPARPASTPLELLGWLECRPALHACARSIRPREHSFAHDHVDHHRAGIASVEAPERSRYPGRRIS